MNNIKPLTFSHIPKAGGNTLRFVIQRQYKSVDLYYKGDDFERWRTLKQKVDSGYVQDLIIGHIYFGLHKFLPDYCSPKYITMLRHPIQRIVSLYNYIKSDQAGDWLKDEIKDLTFSDYIRNGLEVDIENSQTRRIAGIDYSYSNLAYGSCTKEVLELAEFNLENYFLTPGLLDFFDGSLLLWQTELQWKFPFYTRKNRTKNNFINYQDLSKEDLNLLHELNEFDFLLYQKSKEILIKRLNDLPLYSAKKKILQLGSSAMTRIANFKNTRV